MTGWLRPAILFPANLVSEIEQNHLASLLAHELAHVQRSDYLFNAAQACIEALLFFHPGVWWVSREVRREREYCCDDLAVQAIGSPVIYARALLSLEERRAPANPQLLIGVSGGHLTMRITRLLEEQAAASKRGTKLLLATISAAMLTVFCGLSVLATGQVMAATSPAAASGTTASSSEDKTQRPDMSCSFYDHRGHERKGVCEEEAGESDRFTCRQVDKKERQVQMACKWKVERLQEWEREQGLVMK